MSASKIEITPMRAAVKADAETLLDILVTITPPMPEVHFVRPPLNLGLVLDRSGSMAARGKMDYARKAAIYAVEQLLPEDRVGVTIFDSEVETIAPNAPARNKPHLVRQIEAIHPRGGTDLHGGWKEGGRQVMSGLVADGLNRVILLSDGLANEGVTEPNTIATEVKGLMAQGVSTTTMGLGSDYNEDLMQLMGESGDGNYYFIETPVQLADIFATELRGLMATVGNKVSLGVEGQGGATLAEVLNDCDRVSTGRFKMPNLLVGMPISVVVRMKVPATPREAEILRVRLAWDDARTQKRTVQYEALTMPGVASSRWDALPSDPRVAEQVAIQMAARAKKEAIAAYDRGDEGVTRAWVGYARECMEAVPTTAASAQELEEIAKLKADLAEGKFAEFRKRASHQHYDKKRGH